MNVIPSFTKQRLNKDIALVVLFNIIMLLIFHEIDFLETLYDYSQQFEEYELDEIIPLFFTISLSLLVFIFRRYGELKTLCSQALESSNRDHLTGLYNRRYIQHMFNVEAERSKRKRAEFSILIIDIDDFKKINDTYGHDTGDKVLVQLSDIMLSITRTPDIVSRWGGKNS